MGTKYKVFMRVSRNENTEEESNLLLQRCLQKEDTEDGVSTDLVSFLQWTLWGRASSGGRLGRNTLCGAWWKKVRNVGCVAIPAIKYLKELSIAQTVLWKVKVATWEMMLVLPYLPVFSTVRDIFLNTTDATGCVSLTRYSQNKSDTSKISAKHICNLRVGPLIWETF